MGSQAATDRSGGSGKPPKCAVCGVSMTSYVNMKEHLLGRQHQTKAKQVPINSKRHRDSSYFTAHVSAELNRSEVQKIFETFETYGHLKDFRFAVNENGSKKRAATQIHVEWEKKVSAERALAASAAGKLALGSTGLRIVPATARSTPKKSPKKAEQPVPTRPPPAAVPCGGGAEDPAVLLTTLAHMVRTRSEDDVLCWLADRLLLTPDQHQQRVRYCHELQSALRSRFRTCLVQAFGSSVSGLGLRGCDLDLYAFVDAHGHGSGLPADACDKRKVRAVAELLLKLPQLCSDIVRILQARVPIVKFHAPPLGNAQCDMSFKDPMSCQNSRLIGWMMKADPRVRPLTVAVRYWARRRNLAGGEFHPLKMSSYCLTLLVVTFLQQLQPPVLPTVDWCQEGVGEMRIGPWNAAFSPAAVWDTENTAAGASQLLRHFFRFYAAFAAETSALCPLMGKVVPRSALRDRLAGRELARPAVWAGFCDLVSAGRVEPLADDTPLVVQDPMELNYNVARNYRQQGLERFRACCQQAADMPLERLFDEEALPKTKKGASAAAAAPAAVSAVAAVTAVAKRSLEIAEGRGGEPAAQKARHGETGAGGCAPPVPAAGGEQSQEVTSSSGAGDACSPPPAAPAARRGCVTSDPVLLRRVLADFDRQPSRLFGIPLESPCGRRRPDTGPERARAAAAFACLLEEVFTVVLRFECSSMTFDGLELPMNVVRGFVCTARLPTWDFRKTVSGQLCAGAERRRTLGHEAQVTERALRMAGSPAPQPLASFSCYLVLLEEEGDRQLRVCLYEGDTAKAGKNCYTFLERYLPDLATQIDYVALFGDRAETRTEPVPSEGPATQPAVD